MMKNKQFLIALLVAAFVFILFNWLPVKPKPFGDDIFNKEAYYLAQCIKGNSSLENFSFKHVPTASIYYIIPAIFSEDGPNSSSFLFNCLIWNGIFFLLSIYLMFYTFKNIQENRGIYVGNKDFWLLLILLLLPPVFIYYSYGISSEPLTVFLLALLAYIQSRNNNNFLISSIILGFLIITRPNIILIIPLIFLLFIYARNIYFLKISILALVVFYLLNLSFSLFGSAEKKDKVTFLVEQIFYGQFFLRSEPTDWSFFNNEYREGSKDYEDKNNADLKVAMLEKSGMRRKNAMLKVLVMEIKEKPLSLITLPVTKFIHGNTFHIGSTISGPLTFSYISKYKSYFIVNVLLAIVTWLLIIFAILFLIKNKGAFITYWYLVMPWIALCIFNMISASEQRYIFPGKLLLIILAYLYIHSIISKKNVYNKSKIVNSL